MNVSIVSDDKTARTDPECAVQRAVNMASLLPKSPQFVPQTVLELCVGPSLKTLESAYARVGLECIGNDIDERWVDYHSRGQWRVGDAFSVSWQGVQGVVFAPPLSKGCTGRRRDSLMIDQVRPSYRDFLRRLCIVHENQHVTRLNSSIKVVCLVLPARCLATSRDREQLYHLIHDASKYGRVEPVELTSGWRKIRKYVDLYIELDRTI